MNIILAKSAGFCYGVTRAVDTVYELADKENNICTLGPLIHNKTVVDELSSKGVSVISDIDSAIGKNKKVVIRTHGVPEEIYKKLTDNNIPYIDATCPYVKKIHKIVKNATENKEKVIIIGDENHPEVIGINGWANNDGIVCDSLDELIKLDLSREIKYTVVAQTTYNIEKFKEIKNFLKNHFTFINIFDTICNATNNRQQECGEISKEVDAMIIIGGFNSSNTVKLYNIAKNHCPNTYHIESAAQLPLSELKSYNNIGITAGASTPATIIKEVIHIMSENVETNEIFTEESFAEAFEKSFVTLNTGDVVTGTVIGVTPTEVFVNLGFKMDGYIPASELSEDPDVKPCDVAKVGDEIKVFVVRVSDVEGTVMLSKKKIASIEGWKTIEEAFENKTILEGKVVDVVKGGIIVLTSGTRVFVPASQASDRFLGDLSSLLNTEVRFRIIDIKPRRKVVGSVKNVLIEEKNAKSEELWSKIEVGQVLTGVVKSLTNFGAFVDIGGVDALIHISELSWTKIKHPSEVLSVGDVVTVNVLELDKEKNKVSLGFKKAEDNPWNIISEKYNVGDVINCTVVRLVPFGAFVSVETGVDGLIHISQIANKRIGKPQDVLKVGQEVTAKIMEIDMEQHKISLSMRALIEETEEPAAEEAPVEAATEEVSVEEAPLEETAQAATEDNE